MAPGCSSLSANRVQRTLRLAVKLPDSRTHCRKLSTFRNVLSHGYVTLDLIAIWGDADLNILKMHLVSSISWCESKMVQNLLNDFSESDIVVFFFPFFMALRGDS